MDLEVQFGNERQPVGTARDNPAKIADMTQALQSVDDAVRAGLFAPRDEVVWRFEIRFPSPEDWAEFVDKPTCGGIEADQAQLDAALARQDGCIVLTEDDLASVYTRREW